MANRICPLCFGKVARTAIVARTNEVVCPRCGRTLELSRPSRLLASFLGLIGAWLTYRFTAGVPPGVTAGTHDSLGWVLPVLASILAFGVISPLFLLLHADLVVKPDVPAEPVAAAPTHTHAAHH